MSMSLQPSLDSIDRGLSSAVSRLGGLSSLVDADESVHDAREPALDGSASALVVVGETVVEGSSCRGLRSCSAPRGPVTAASDEAYVAETAPSRDFGRLDEAQERDGQRYFIGDSDIGQFIGGTLDCYQSFPLGISVDVPARAVVCLDGYVESYNDRVTTLDCGDYRATVNRRCLRRRDFELIGVEPVCLVVKSLVSPPWEPTGTRHWMALVSR